MKKIISPITGKQKYLLIENCEFVSNTKISKELKESLQLSNGKGGTLIVKNLPGTILNRENQNGRVYSTEVLLEAIRDAKPLFETKQLLSQADEHPEGSFVAPTHASHVVTNAYIKKNVNVTVDGEPGTYDMLFMDIEVLNTEEGKNLRALLEAECSVGTSIRGVGDMQGKYVKNYEILGIDFVGNPSSYTYTRMPVSESAQVELRDDRELKETFTVTTTSTNVTRDLEQAAALQQQLEAIGYGTVTKTSTKLDQETDPKTGAQTSITTLEAETSDDVSDLDQALQMARNAMLNGTVNVDSVTIENVPEEGEEGTNKESVEYEPEVTQEGITEAKKEDEDPNNGRKFVLKAGNRGFVTKNDEDNGIDFTEEPENALHFVQGHEENGMIPMSKVTEILDGMGIYEVQKYFQRIDTNLGGGEEEKEPKEEGLVGDINISTSDVGVGGVGSIAKQNDEEDKDPKEEGVLASLGAVAGLPFGMPVAGYKMGNAIASSTPDANQPDTEAGTKAISEENGSNTKYMAQVTINDANGSNNETVPVSATDLEGAKKEIANLYDMKAKTVENGTLDVMLIDTVTGQQLRYNGQSGLFESSEDGLEINGDTTEVDVDDDITIEKQFDSPIQAKVAAAAVEKGKVDPEILVPEAVEDEEITCAWCKDKQAKIDCQKEKDLGWLCPQCVRALESQGVEMEFEDGMDEKLYTKPSEPSDEVVKVTLNEENSVNVTLSNIDWDMEAILNDLDDGEDIDEVIENLPDPITVRVSLDEFENMEPKDTLKQSMIAMLNKKLPWPIFDADLQTVQDDTHDDSMETLDSGMTA